MPKFVTKNTHEKWAQRVKDLKREVREVCGDINEAAKLGDLRENSEYQYSVERRDRLMNEMKALDDALNSIRQFIEEMRPEPGICDIGTKVTFRREDDEEFEFAIMGCTEDESPKGGKVVPYEAPLANQLLRKRVGDVVTVSIPAWTMDVEIISVEVLFE